MVAKPGKTTRPVDTCGRKVHPRWDAGAAVTAYKQMPCFIEFLKTAVWFDDWIAACPLDCRSPKAPAERDVLGTLLLSLLAESPERLRPRQPWLDLRRQSRSAVPLPVPPCG